jgi:hypothetical protein
VREVADATHRTTSHEQDLPRDARLKSTQRTVGARPSRVEDLADADPDAFTNEPVTPLCVRLPHQRWPRPSWMMKSDSTRRNEELWNSSTRR